MLTARIYTNLYNRKNGLQPILSNFLSSQYWTTDSIREYQLSKIEVLLRHAYHNVPYYHRLFESHGLHPSRIRDLTDFGKIPVLTKEIMRKHFNDLIARNIDNVGLKEDSTGGSTGTPLKFLHDRNYVRHADAGAMRAWLNVKGYRLGDTYALLWGAMKDVKSDYSLLERLIAYTKYGEIPMNAFNLSRGRKLDFIKWCRLLRPKLIRAYITALKDLAEFVDHNKINFPKVNGIVVGAETVDDKSRGYIERIFRTKVYNSYGCREVGFIAMECEDGSLHQYAENNYVEFMDIDLDDKSNVAEVLITNLNNFAMPFIRYKIGDLAIKSSQGSCSCGRGLPLIERVIGRTTDVFKFYDGTAVSGEMFIHLMKDFEIPKYQFVQVSPYDVELRVRTCDKVDVGLKERIMKQYMKYLPDRVNIRFVETDEFDTTATGKFRFVKVQMDQ